MPVASFVLLLITALLLGLYHFFIRQASGYLHQIVGAVVLQAVAAGLGGMLLLNLWLRKTALPATATGFWLAALAGLAVGGAEILTFYIFAKGTPVSVGMPIIVGGSVAVGVLLGVLFLGESLTWRTGLGLVLVLAGVALLAGK